MRCLAFDKDVVQIAAPAIHWDFDFDFSQSCDPARACILVALICVHDLWLAVFGNNLLQRLNAEANTQRIWEPASQHFSRHPIHDRHQMKKAVFDWDVGYVAAPNLIGSRDWQLS